ncbi:MAG: demethoxyubiquinone hydroxylase family protein [Alphaproteobacteria bacterium]|nr:demethoxyubiquinone hydroxylase family protein [Alphaproteobacteria bacterium]
MSAALNRLLAGETEVERLRRLVRVNHAGEFGAARIYDGQLAVLTDQEIRHMREQEQVHLEAFERRMKETGTRPTVLLPVWRVAGYALGWLTARMSRNAAMACTVAVESVIDRHYAEQIARVENGELKEELERFRAEEMEHHDTALEAGAEEARGYQVLNRLIQPGSRLAIWLSTRW